MTNSILPTTEQLVTLYDAARDRRLLADKVAEELKEKETALKVELMASMTDANLNVAGNSEVFFTLREKERKKVLDWNVVYEYIRENNAFDLLQRRLNEAAVEEREEEIPGITSYKFQDLSRPQKVK